MKTYLKNILSRLQQYSKSLDKVESFVDKPWVFIDSNNNQQTYIFKRDGRLIMSLSGDAKTGKWEYIPASKSLLIDRGIDQLLLNQAFFTEALMLLKKDGVTEDALILINKNIIPDLNYEDYLRKLFIEKLSLVLFRNSDGKIYYYSDPNNYGIGRGTRFFTENFAPLEHDFKFQYQDQTISGTDGIVRSRTFSKTYNTDRGKLIVVQNNETYLSIGEQVFDIDSKPAEGIYRFTDNKNWKSIEAENGKIKSTKEKRPMEAVIFVAVLAFIAVLILLFALSNHNASTTVVSTDNIAAAPAADTTTAPTPMLSEPTNEDFEGIISDYISSINSRSFTNMQRYFSPTIKYFYGQHDVDPLSAVKTLESFWTNQPTGSSLDYIVSSLSHESDNYGGYIVHLTQIEKSADSNKLPYIYTTNQKYFFDDNKKIYSMTGKIESKVPDVIRFFDLGSYSSESDLMNNITAADVNKILYVSVSLDSNVILNSYFKKAVLAVLSPTVKVYYDKTTKSIPLDAYLDILLTKEYRYNKVDKLFKNADGKVNGIEISAD